ncbi:bifunctional riboflavin kinase/FAD synthetase [Sphingomonas sp. SM33]|uniref:Riboflavin biosynthesis protein n=1 Tax=Sphingomonas telluris TaxID=2907998 RepID=A0ABS9VMX2_9SPHN|nr:bifunctional riboflavin kinase/FAD synthetase [Sphingomonas telluris]MCH8616302.1 bifunctional riboflavin kinase/FAD synthetase [Sphingomonas telluris]
MQRLHHDQPIPEALRGAVLALGNFDGFHLGHQAVVSRAIALGFHMRRPVIVATFDPHPVRYFKPDVPPFRLTTLDQRQELFAHAGADAMLVFEFGPDLAATSAEKFVTEILAGRIGAAGVVTGDDFTFGKGRTGSIEMMRELGARHGITAEAVCPVLYEGERISSGRIRDALEAGDVARATHLLTRDFAIEGVVQRGDQRGRELGYPTANLVLGDYQRAKYGIYAVRVRLDDGREVPGVASLGIRPTFEPPVELLETHILDFDGDLYGRKIEVGLHAYIREEKRFGDIQGLVAHMKDDEARARHLLALD